MPHHTKDKGDLGVVKAQVDLVQRGYLVLIPLSEHAPFDLVAYKQREFLRIQVKYRSAANGVLRVVFRTSWADRNGTHERPVDKEEIDLICVYCPETDQCYYFTPQESSREVSLRITAPKNNQAKHVRMAGEFRKIP
jgi:hypothetical protein